jgi:hypothetical protein
MAGLNAIIVIPGEFLYFVVLHLIKADFQPILMVAIEHWSQVIPNDATDRPRPCPSL